MYPRFPVIARALVAGALAAATGCTSANPGFDPSFGGVDAGSGNDSLAPALDVAATPPDAAGDVLVVAPDVGPPPPPPPPPKPTGVDVLFVIDNSNGMATPQFRLARDVGELIGGLQKLPGGPSYRVGIVTTNLGAAPYGTESCGGAGDAGKLYVRNSCDARPNDGRSYIEYVGGKRNVSGSVQNALSCLLRVGTNGCGFEQPLEAMRVALSGANPGFLRPTAALAVVILSNEDDCSAANKELFNPQADFGPLSSYRCFQHGVLCSGAQPPLAVTKLQGCVPGQSTLHPIKARYLDALAQLKPPGWTSALVIAGPVEPTLTVEKLSTFDGVQYYRVGSTCQSGSFSGDPALRLTSFSAGLAQLGHFDSICKTDYRPALSALLSRIQSLF